jgi:hypothetical protein
MKEWELSIGFYPGILLGVRTYKYQGKALNVNHPEFNKTDHVFYLPLIDLCITIYHERTDITRNEK